MSEINNILGGKIPLAIGPKTYYLSQLTDKLRAQYEQHLEEESLLQLQRQKKLLGDDYLPALSKLNVDIVSGAFNFGGPAFLQSMQSRNGILYMLFLLLSTHQPEITLAEATELGLNHAAEIGECINRALDSGVKKKQPQTKKKRQKIIQTLEEKSIIV